MIANLLGGGTRFLERKLSKELQIGGSFISVSKGLVWLRGIGLARARGGVLLDLRKGGVSSQAPPRPCSPSTVCAVLDIVRPFFAGLYGCGYSERRGI